ncbi:MAG: Rrf2 family transcriptional regulator [Capsulimonadaceae bacterium]|nr:Rrf2 family transcriptional regulator [Capsulimonadaceae bacterium]
MNVSTRYTVALHILILMATDKGTPMTSEFIAGSVNTNPVFIRRLLGRLKDHGFVESQSGARGGWLLCKSPDAIRLSDVRLAMEEGSPFTMHTQQPNPACPVGRSIQGVLGNVFARAERAMYDDLAKSTVADLLESVYKQNEARQNVF